MKLAEPKFHTSTFRHEFEPEFSYLAGGKPAWLEIDCRPGGYLNPELMAAFEEIDTRARIAALEAKARRSAAKDADARNSKNASERIAAIVRHCVIDWRTNILDDGKPMDCTDENIRAMCEVKHPAIAAALVAFFEYVNQTADFLGEADEDAEKN